MRQQSCYQNFFKRLFDFIGSILGLIILAPIFVGIASVSLVTLGRPLIFSHRRVGLNGREIHVHKFRSMTNSPRAKSPIPHVTLQNDSRISKFGRFLRRYKLDELPQLFNILIGEMSFVGPRPQVREYLDLIDEEVRTKLLSVRPGLTDPSSLKYVNESALLTHQANPRSYYEQVVLPDKAKLSSEYALQASLLTDVRLIVATCFEIPKRK